MAATASIQNYLFVPLYLFYLLFWFSFRLDGSDRVNSELFYLLFWLILIFFLIGWQQLRQLRIILLYLYLYLFYLLFCLSFRSGGGDCVNSINFCAFVCIYFTFCFVLLSDRMAATAMQLLKIIMLPQSVKLAMTMKEKKPAAICLSA